MATKKPHISSRDPDTVFELISQIGSGSYGTVQKARVIKTGKLAAVKLINMEDGEEFEDVENEIALLEKCHHENVVAYYGSFIKQRTMWICMEFCGAGSVSDLYGSLGAPLSELEIAHIMLPSLRGLEYLHQQRMIHRDIKGGNILLTDDGKVKLADLGVSAQLSSTLAKRKSFIGTPYWIAPEIIAVEMKMGPDGYSNKCDVWSLAITAIEFAELAPPMFDLHPMRALYLIPKNPPPRLADKSKWSKDFRDWIKQALTKNPSKRPSATQLCKHSWFKGVNPAKPVLEEFIQRCRSAGAPKRKGLVEEFSDEELDDEKTMTPGDKKSNLKRVASVRGGAKQAGELPVTTVVQEDTPNEAKPGWGNEPVTPYVPLAAGAGAGVAESQPVYPPNSGRVVSDDRQAKMYEGQVERQQSADGHSSFVLTNVFAGCPLKVLCAASWKCQPKGRSTCLYIIVGAESGLYVLETMGDRRELVQVSKRACTWLYVMDEEGMMISVSGKGLVCVHDLNSLLVKPGEEIRFKTTKLVEGAKGGRCAVTRTPDTGYTFLCVVITRQLVLMQWYQPRKKFMKLKDFQTPFEEPPNLMELLVLDNEQLPVLCVGATRDKKSRTKAFAIVNPNFPPEKMAKHMSAELGWVRVRAGREDVFATAVRQIGDNRFMLCFSNVASFIDLEGRSAVAAGEPEKIVFETAPETVVYTPDAVIAFSAHRMERRSVHTGRITHQMKDKGESFRVVGKHGNIIIETRAEGEATSHLYLLVRK
eukprot:m.20558 g.20558  ORF g.20558 m.20558 type:complete len:759 (-) comp6199_c1_seq1:115-2391(-)